MDGCGDSLPLGMLQNSQRAKTSTALKVANRVVMVSDSHGKITIGDKSILSK